MKPWLIPRLAERLAAHRRTILRLALAGVLVMAATSLLGASSIFDDDWKPPPPSAKPAPVAPTKPPDEAVTAAPRIPKRTAPPPVQPTPGPIRPAGPTPALPALPSRSPVPAGVALTAAEKEIHDIFKAEYASKTAVEQIAFARTLLSEAQQSRNDPATLYVLLRDARDMASTGGEPEVAIEAARGMRDNFLIDGISAKEMEHSTLTAAIKALVANPTALASYEVLHRASDLALQLAELDLTQNDYAGAAQIGAVAETAAFKTHDWEYPSRVHGRVAWMQSVDAEYEQDRGFIAALKTNPADPIGNLAAGRFDFVYLDRPDLGLPLLAKSLDASLKGLAVQDLAASGPASTPAQLTAVADAWTEAAKSEPPPIKDAMQRRALSLYERAMQSAQGLELAAAQKKRESLRVSRVVRGLNGSYFRGENLGSFGVARVDNRLEFVWDQVVPDLAVPRERFSARWTGWVKAVPGTYKLIVIYDDGVRVWIDGQLITDKWGDLAGKTTAEFTFTGRLQEIKVELRQRDGGACLGLGWIAPGATKAKAIPNGAFYRDPLPPGPVTAPCTTADADGTIHLIASAAALHGSDLRYMDGSDGVPRIAYWRQTTDWLSWDFFAPRGDYYVDLKYACEQSSAGSTYTLSCGADRLNGTVESTGNWANTQTVRLGQIRLGRGMQSLRIKPTAKPGGSVMDLHAITLTPIKAGD